jgi:hypothetical protein
MVELRAITMLFAVRGFSVRGDRGDFAMGRWMMAIGAGLLGVAIAAPQPQAAKPRFAFIDLRSKANHKLTDRFGRIAGNTLESLPTGQQTFAGVKFNVESDVLQLASPRLQVPKADKMEGIVVNRTAHKIHFLHGTVFGNSNPAIYDDTTLAEFTIRYADGSAAKVPVVYGEDVRDWLSPEECRVVRRGKIAWVGDNNESRRLERHLYLYLATWENSKPEKRIAAIDYAKVGENPASPFCVAITAEE